jgi:hypothetical protein
MCSVVLNSTLVLSYQPREAMLASSKFSWKRRFPGGGGGGAGAVTVMDDVPDFPELVAVMVAVPAATPVTRPLEFTAAIPALLVDQVTAWPLMVLP